VRDGRAQQRRQQAREARQLLGLHDSAAQEQQRERPTPVLRRGDP